MNSEYIKDKFNLIDDTIDKIKTVQDKKLLSMLSNYLVVFISGIYEDCVEQLFIERACKNDDEQIQNLVKNLIDKHFRNPMYREVKKWVKYFDSKYVTTFQSKIDDKNIQAIDSIVENKNRVAHGENSNATFKDVNIWYNNSLKIFEVLEEILL